MPQIVIDEPALGKERIAGRQSESRHVVDQGDLGVIENGVRKIDRIAGEFGQDRRGRRHSQQCRSGIRPSGNARRWRLLIGVTAGPRCEEAGHEDSNSTAAIVAAENGTKKNIGSASALCTAQPSAGAIGNASPPGTRRRVIARPRLVQNSVATAAQRMTLMIDAIGFDDDHAR